MSEPYVSPRNRIFAFICRFKREHDGCSPTVREIAEAVGLSTTAIFHQLNKLEDENRIVRRLRGTHSRCIEIVGKYAVWGQ